MKILTGTFLGLYTKSDKDNYHVLLVNRWDGRIGFVGGFVGDENENESIKDALVREAKEEIGYDISDKEIKVEREAEYKKDWGKLVLNFTPLRIDYEEFMKVLKGLPNSEHFLYETMGYSIFTINEDNIKNYEETKQYKNFIKNNLATDVKEELNYILDKIKKENK